MPNAELLFRKVARQFNRCDLSVRPTVYMLDCTTEQQHEGGSASPERL